MDHHDQSTASGDQEDVETSTLSSTPVSLVNTPYDEATPPLLQNYCELIQVNISNIKKINVTVFRPSKNNDTKNETPNRETREFKTPMPKQKPLTRTKKQTKSKTEVIGTQTPILKRL